ncbi:MAG TPA: MFS transporter [Acetomicrobium flavidum]|uniref:Major Facilitator Superfamily transporter n=1 Tax=Acetomicrobium mobile (strain ATCC BAA-54 / DSM 13181 / JCM 12221 / NGA) TaxID=891968 RepID=I4BTW7_ACEMN|nr:MFS transporter [Acetomicrobium mobile]AFM20724.1 Major Facilitator Superfamily transporter [Acetomicrobium mobile DSM 13181]HOP87549.1 MFS transporter [Acetomicrobium flavidum]HPU68505.1 MFS transporter [Acetomicrobium flavidum]
MSDNKVADSIGKASMRFILMMGLVSLCGDMAYEGARSSTGAFMATLGASAGVVGFVAGFGELLGYVVRIFSGHLADRTKAYWPLVFLGYGLILSVPLLALAPNWQIAAIFILAERLGKAIRSPARDALLSYATKNVGRGWGFGIHEAMDQVGAIAGPLIMSLALYLGLGFRGGFSFLFVPAAVLLLILNFAKKTTPAPQSFEAEQKTKLQGDDEKLPPVFWRYMLFICLAAVGLVPFQIMAYHMKANSIVSDISIPIYYAIAMGIDGLFALVIGKLYDSVGLRSLIFIPIFTLPIPLFALSRDPISIGIGVGLWGLAMAVHETIMRAAIADIVPPARRGTAYGIFNAGYGIAVFCGSMLIGWLYDISLAYVILFVLASVLMTFMGFVMFLGRYRP